MKIVWQSALSVVLGFVGGVVAVNTGFHLKRHEVRAEVVRANRFELVDSFGNPLAYWAKDEQRQRVEIAFVDTARRPKAEFGIEASELKSGQAVTYSPFEELVGSDGRARLHEGLDSSQEPVLAMGDSNTENRLLLGHWKTTDVAGATGADAWDKWSLVLRDPSHGGWRDYLDIGATTPQDSKQRTGYIILRSSTGSQLSELPKK